jgi:RimJ/RimL family protein N-acetyltransferase
VSQNFTVILETPRLLLRRQVIEDLDALWALYCDPEIIRYIPDAPKTYLEAREELEWHQNGHPDNPQLGLWATIHKATGRFIGRCGLLPWTIDGRLEVEVAYAIARDFWSQGLGTEAAQAIVQYAFEKLKLERLVCMIEPENRASVNVAKKIGMSFEKEMEDEAGPYHLYSRSKQSPALQRGDK